MNRIFGPMNLYHDYGELRDQVNSIGRVVTIGNFDGVHLGHQTVIQTGLKEARRRNLEYGICTFEPHPSSLFRKGAPLLRLVTPSRKYDLLAEQGVSLILAQRFDEAFAALSAEEFVRLVLVDALKTQLVIVGENFQFGNGRTGNVGFLKSMGEQFGFQVHGEPLVHGDAEGISSSRIRAFIRDGRMEEATALLGRFHEISGRVVKGKGVGTGLGVPTVNLDGVEVLLPANGIYAAFCVLPDGTRRMAAAYIGDRPTLCHGRSLEAFLLDFSGDLYGARLVLKFVAMLRPEEKFDSLESLRRQMNRDIDRAREILEALDDGQ